MDGQAGPSSYGCELEVWDGAHGRPCSSHPFWVVGLWRSPSCSEPRFSHLKIGVLLNTISKEGRTDETRQSV